MKQYDNAFKYAYKTRDLKLKYLSNNHPNLAKSYILIGKIFTDKQQYRQALEQYEKAMEIQRVNLSNDNIDIIKVKLDIGCIHCQMGKLDRLPENFDDKINLYSTIECFELAIKLYHVASEYAEKDHKYADAYKYELNSVHIRQYQWSEVFFSELNNSNIENFHTLENLKQLLPISRIQLKTILHNFYYIFKQCHIVQQRKQIDNNLIFDKKKDFKEKADNLEILLLSFWSDEEKQKYADDRNRVIYNHVMWKLTFDRERFFSEIEYELKKLPNFKVSISLDILEEEKEVSQYLSTFMYDLFEHYNLGKLDLGDYEDIDQNMDKDADEDVDTDMDEDANEDVDKRSRKNPFKNVKVLLLKCIIYGRESARLNNAVDAATLFILAL
ncbi:unnamed protein product, partial [Didymodactylos carnosus]